VQVSIYEKRGDYCCLEKDPVGVELHSKAFGTSTSATKRSINLALSERGMIALKEVGALDTVMQHAVRMPCRVIHSINRPDVKQAYGQANEAIWSVGRKLINRTLLQMAERDVNVQLFFDYSYVSCSDEGICTFESSSGRVVTDSFDLVIGADGAYSSVRDSMLRKGRINFSRQYIGHGYKELCIPPVLTPVLGGEQSYVEDYALSNPEGLHIWPRKEFMLIAIPNPDKSFTATLFAPYKGNSCTPQTYTQQCMTMQCAVVHAIGHCGFNTVQPDDEQQVRSYFEEFFPDVLAVAPDICCDYRDNPVGSLVTIRTDPWTLGRILLIGDAAHAVVPFYGQGMNAAFQDGYLLYQVVRSALEQSSATAAGKGRPEKIDLQTCAVQFSTRRLPAANVLADLCLEHYADMASNTASSLYLLRKKIEAALGALFPKTFVPLYTMIAFRDIPYDEALRRAHQQEAWVSRIIALHVSLLGICAAAGVAWHRWGPFWKNNG